MGLFSLLAITLTLLPQDNPDLTSAIREILTENFRILPPEERAALGERIERAIGRLEGPLREKALRHARDCTISATVFLKSTDEYRAVAARNPELVPLVLPDEYHRTAYLAAVDRIEADVERATQLSRVDPARLAEVGAQMEALRAAAKEVASRRFTGIQGAAAELASQKIDEIVDGFKNLQENPFFWMDKPLDPDGYASVIFALQERINTLPILIPGGNRPSDEAVEPENAPVTEASRIEALIGSALKPLFQYPRLSRPKSFEARDKITRLEAEGRAWMAEAKSRHEHFYAELQKGSFPKHERARSPEAKSKPLVGREETKESPLPLPANSRAPASPNPHSEGAHSRSMGLALLALLIVTLCLVFYWRAVRKSST